jgi:hypothetical protein
MLRHGLAAAVVLGLPAPQVVAAAQPGAVWPSPRECSNIDRRTQRRCIGRRVEAKSRLVEQLFPRALASVRSGFGKWGRNDSRLDPRRFAEAHRDWKRYIGSNCTAVGAIGGGSNSSISDRITACYERELDARIELYRQIAEGTYGP